MITLDDIALALQTRSVRADFDDWVDNNERDLSDLFFSATGEDLSRMRFDNFFYREIERSTVYREFRETGHRTDAFDFFLNLIGIAAENLARVRLDGVANTLVTELPNSPAKSRLLALTEFAAVENIREDYIRKFPVVLVHLDSAVSTAEHHNTRQIIDSLIFFYQKAKTALLANDFGQVFEKLKALYRDEELLEKYPFLDHPVLQAMIGGEDPFTLWRQPVTRSRLEPSMIMQRVFREINQEYYDYPGINHFGGSIFGLTKDDILEHVLMRGRADFGEPYRHITAEQKVLIYCFFNMKKHFFTSYAVYQIVLDSLKAVFAMADYQPVFIDLGCGPMTSGLALADLLHTTTGHTIRMDYIGVDIAPPMLERAERFEEVRFFAEGSNFYYYRNWNDIPIELLKTMASRQTPIILNASYLFASRSLDGEDLAQFVIEQKVF